MNHHKLFALNSAVTVFEWAQLGGSSGLSWSLSWDLTEAERSMEVSHLVIGLWPLIISRRVACAPLHNDWRGSKTTRGRVSPLVPRPSSFCLYPMSCCRTGQNKSHTQAQNHGEKRMDKVVCTRRHNLLRSTAVPVYHVCLKLRNWVSTEPAFWSEHPSLLQDILPLRLEAQLPLRLESNQRFLSQLPNQMLGITILVCWGPIAPPEAM